MKRLLTATFMALLSCHAGAVSRVGGGKISGNDNSFEALVPQSYPNVFILNDVTVRANGSPLFIPGVGSVLNYIDITDFEVSYSSLVNFNLPALDAEMKKYGLIISNESNQCVRVYDQLSENVRARTVVWGIGKGIVLKGSNTRQVDQGIKDIFSSLVVNKDYCTWN